MAISAQKVRQAEPSSKVVLALAGAMLAILCVLVLMAAAANRGGTVRTFSQPATVSVGQGAGDHARSEKQAGGQDDGSGQTGSQPTHGPLP